MKNTQRQQIIVGISGASGAPYARRLVQLLCDNGVDVHLVVSPNGKRLLHDELGLEEVSAQSLLNRENAPLTIYPYRDVGAKIASGSFDVDAMVICPCSSNTLAALAAGLGDNLLNRAAAVTLKESRRLILVTREIPMSRIELRNALTLNEAGAIICPAAPGFYMLPKTVSDLVDFVVGKLLDLLKIPHELDTRWDPQVQPKSARGGQSE